MGAQHKAHGACSYLGRELPSGRRRAQRVGSSGRHFGPERAGRGTRISWLATSLVGLGHSFTHMRVGQEQTVCKKRTAESNRVELRKQKKKLASEEKRKVCWPSRFSVFRSLVPALPPYTPTPATSSSAYTQCLDAAVSAWEGGVGHGGVVPSRAAALCYPAFDVIHGLGPPSQRYLAPKYPGGRAGTDGLQRKHTSQRAGHGTAWWGGRHGEERALRNFLECLSTVRGVKCGELQRRRHPLQGCGWSCPRCTKYLPLPSVRPHIIQYKSRGEARQHHMFIFGCCATLCDAVVVC